MSDGPFKNLKLGKRWKQYAEAVQNDAFDRSMCCAMASHALVCEILTDNVKHLLTTFLTYASRTQLELDPSDSVERIFNEHCKVPFVDTLQKEVSFRMSDMVSPPDAIKQALDATVSEHIRETSNRIEEECIRARDSGEMRQDQFYRAVSQSRVIFDSLDKNEICKVLLDGSKNAFKNAVSKKKGLDEGPSL